MVSVSFIPFCKTTQNMVIKGYGVIIDKICQPTSSYLITEGSWFFTRMIIGSMHYYGYTVGWKNKQTSHYCLRGRFNCTKRKQKRHKHLFFDTQKLTSDTSWILRYLFKGQFKTKCQIYYGGRKKTMSSLTRDAKTYELINNVHVKNVLAWVKSMQNLTLFFQESE